jgi:hypothetical protein
MSGQATAAVPSHQAASVLALFKSSGAARPLVADEGHARASVQGHVIADRTGGDVPEETVSGERSAAASTRPTTEQRKERQEHHGPAPPPRATRFTVTDSRGGSSAHGTHIAPLHYCERATTSTASI